MFLGIKLKVGIAPMATGVDAADADTRPLSMIVFHTDRDG